MFKQVEDDMTPPPGQSAPPVLKSIRTSSPPDTRPRTRPREQHTDNGSVQTTTQSLSGTDNIPLQQPTGQSDSLGLRSDSDGSEQFASPMTSASSPTVHFPQLSQAEEEAEETDAAAVDSAAAELAQSSLTGEGAEGVVAEGAAHVSSPHRKSDTAHETDTPFALTAPGQPVRRQTEFGAVAEHGGPSVRSASERIVASPHNQNPEQKSELSNQVEAQQQTTASSPESQQTKQGSELSHEDAAQLESESFAQTQDNRAFDPSHDKASQLQSAASSAQTQSTGALDTVREAANATSTVAELEPDSDGNTDAEIDTPAAETSQAERLESNARASTSSHEQGSPETQKGRARSAAKAGTVVS